MMTRMMRIVPRDMVLSQQAPDGKLTPRRVCWAKHIPAACRRRSRYLRQLFGQLFGLQFQRRRIDAVAQAGRAGAVVEHMAEMAVALRAQNLGSDHAVAGVALLIDM